MRTLLRSASLLALATAALSARAVDAYNNLGSPPSYVSSSVQPGYDFVYDGIAELHVDYGFQFAAAVTGTLSGFQVAINRYSSTTQPQSFSLGLYADGGSDTLGTLLGTYGGTSTGVASTSTTALATVAAGGTPVSLASGVKYWLVAAVPTSSLYSVLTWNRSKAPAATPMVTVVNSRGRITTQYGSDTPAAFSVQVTPVPEPASLAALGLGAVALLKRRKRA